jgi:hypothetical protein
MSDEKMEDLGCLAHGSHLYRQRNGAGGWTYYSDECGVMSIVWDTCIANESTILAAVLCEQHRRYMEFMVSGGWRPTKNMVNEKMVGVGGFFLDPIRNESIDGATIAGSGQSPNMNTASGSGILPPPTGECKGLF